MRRWEDWERSRLRKIRREEKRRRDMERSHPSGFFTPDGEYLQAPDTRSQYDSSDTFSMASSDDDHWGAQIGGYNENNAQYPPPPVALFSSADGLQVGKTVDGAELEAMLEQGFDDRPTPPPTSAMPRYQLADNNSMAQLHNVNAHGYAPLSRSGSPGVTPQSSTHLLSPNSPSMPLSGEEDLRDGRPPRGRGAQERYGPLGPLDPSAKF